MQTQMLVKSVRELVTEMREERLESGISGRPVSIDLQREFQRRFDVLVSKVRNPTLACFEDLLSVSEDIGLETDSLRDVVNHGRECLEFY